MSRNTLIASGALAAVVAGGLYVGLQRTGQESVTSAPLMMNAETLVAAEADVDTSSVVEMSLGNPDAPVTVIEYASYTCPHCATFHNTAFKQLRSDYIDTGVVNFIYREVYFDRPGLWASAVARCAGPDRFFAMNDLIYENQGTWSRAGDPASIAGELRKIGLLAGLDAETVDACLQDGEKMQSLVAWYEANAAEHGIRSTPSFVINGETYQNMSFSEMAEIIDEAAGS